MVDVTYTLVIGNKNYSSWSMRAWLLLRFIETPFEEVSIDLYRFGSRAAVQALGGETGLVPVLLDGGTAIWDTLAITEHLYERHPAIWPADRTERARARSYCGEVHSSLHALREAMPVNTRGRNRVANRTTAVDADIERVIAIWSPAGQRADGPWLFGQFCAADVMFAPIASRFLTYGVALEGTSKFYMDMLLSHALVQEWFARGVQEPAVIEQFELPDSRRG